MPLAIGAHVNGNQHGTMIEYYFAEAHPDAVLVIVDKVDEQRVPGKQRLWVWGAAGFLD